MQFVSEVSFAFLPAFSEHHAALRNLGNIHDTLFAGNYSTTEHLLLTFSCRRCCALTATKYDIISPNLGCSHISIPTRNQFAAKSLAYIAQYGRIHGTEVLRFSGSVVPTNRVQILPSIRNSQTATSHRYLKVPVCRIHPNLRSK